MPVCTCPLEVVKTKQQSKFASRALKSMAVKHAHGGGMMTSELQTRTW